MNDALLLIDLQLDFLSDTGRLPVGTANAERVITVANRMAALFEEREQPIFLIYNQFKRSDVLGNLFRRNAAIEGSAGGEIDPRIVVRDPFRLPKARSSAFTNPDFTERLAQTGVGRVVLCGVYAEGRVRATAFDALKTGLETIVLSDGVASNRQAKYKWALSHMGKRGITCLSSDDYRELVPL